MDPSALCHIQYPQRQGSQGSHAILQIQQYWTPQGRAGGKTLCLSFSHTYGIRVLQKHTITGKSELAINGKVSFKVATPRFLNKPAMQCRQGRDPGSWAGQHLLQGQLWIPKESFKLALEAQMNNKPNTRQIKHLVKTPNITDTQLVQVTKSTESLWFVVIKSQHCKIPMPVPLSQLTLLSPFSLRKLCPAKSFLHGLTAMWGEVLNWDCRDSSCKKPEGREEPAQGALQAQAVGKWPLVPSAH